MVFWKEWRETRFGFLIVLIFLTGLLVNTSFGPEPQGEYWRGVVTVLIGIAMAVILGSSAVTQEVTAGTMPFLVSMPARRAKVVTAKYFVRGAEVVIIFLAPTILENSITWETEPNWLWVPPYLGLQYSLLCILAIMFLFSGTFFFSILLRKQTYTVLAGVGLTAVYLAVRGWDLFGKTLQLKSVYLDIQLLALLTVGTFVASLLVFKKREF